MTTNALGLLLITTYGGTASYPQGAIPFVGVAHGGQATIGVPCAACRIKLLPLVFSIAKLGEAPALLEIRVQRAQVPGVD